MNRFWDKVDRSGECWLWTGARDARGYGRFQIETRRCAYAHRLVYEWTHGAVPAGLLVCHRCDVRHCVNPLHLFVGTHADNSQDMVRKGRSMKGYRWARVWDGAVYAGGTWQKRETP